MSNNSYRTVLSLCIALGAASTVSADEILDATTTLPNAKPGECYAKVVIPAEYKMETEEVLVKEPAERIEIIPAKYEWVEEKVLVKEASQKLVSVPATYETVTEKVEVRPESLTWLTSLRGNAPQASPALLEAAKNGGVDLDAATPGMCFHEHRLPAKYETQTEQVLVSEASEKVQIVPAKYEWVEEKVLVKEASQKEVAVPPVYETVTEKVLVEPAKTVWKKGRGLVEKIDNTTGEIMCLVEIPAKYKTITKRVVKTPATTKVVEIPALYKTVKVRKLVSAPQEKRIEIPAKYKTVTKRVKVSDAKFVWHEIHSKDLDASTRTGNQICLKKTPAAFKTVTRRVVKTPAATKTVEIPAKYKTVKVRKLVSPPQEKRIEIPAKYTTVTKRVKVSDQRLEWRSVLCQTNMTPGIISEVQRALKAAGFDPGPIDGVVGSATLRAVSAYQREKGLPRGGLTMDTLKSLGVNI